MSPTPVIAIFDVGKTNKKIFLFDEQYKIVYDETHQIEETKDEDNFACEDVDALTKWVKSSFEKLLNNKNFRIKAVNFSGYGASFVYLDKSGKVIAPLYNYLKPYPPVLQQKFYTDYGGESIVAKQTASPILGSLNSGMQLYRLKYDKPEVFALIKYALHLPQYLSYVICSAVNSDITSIGCHTNLWDFQKNTYHRWVEQEGILSKLAPLKKSTEVAGYIENTIPVGVGLHDSSAALIPYLHSFSGPFILLSTGTWCISLNPFNHSPLTDHELQHDCLCYLSYEGKPVKASRLFAGYEHEQQVKRLSAHFNKSMEYYKKVKPDLELIKNISACNISLKETRNENIARQSSLINMDLNEFRYYEEAYHQLILNLIVEQVQSLNLVLRETAVNQIFVDGGFSENPIYMQLLAQACPEAKIYSASVAQASALGAALAFQKHWNSQPFSSTTINLQLINRS